MDDYPGPGFLIKQRGTFHKSESEEDTGKKELTTECYVDKLSYDVLHLIFGFYIKSRPTVDLCKMSVLISHVCRRWRGYAMDTPTMWTSLLFQRVGRRREWGKELTFLERSKNTPLDIFILSRTGSNEVLSASTTAGILRVLKPHLRRWRTFKIITHTKGMRIISDQLRYDSAPALEILSLRVQGVMETQSRWRCHMFGGGLPKLLAWSSDFGLIPPPSHIPRMPNLLELSLSDTPRSSTSLRRPGVEDIVAILSTCPKLKQVMLIVESSRELGGTLHTINTPALLPNLTSFELFNMSNSNFVRFCSLIKAPRLQSISPRSPTSIITVIASHNPFPGLETLVIGNNTDEDEPELTSYRPSILQSAFLSLSLLSQLTIRDQTLPSHLFHMLQSYCPSLISLVLDECMFTSSDCVRMVKARMESDKLSSLELLKICIPTPDLPDDDKVWLQCNISLFNLIAMQVRKGFATRGVICWFSIVPGSRDCVTGRDFVS